MKRSIILIGAGGHGRVLISAIKALRGAILGILDSDPVLVDQCVFGIPVLGGDDEIRSYSPDSIALVNGIGSVDSTEKRKMVYLKYRKKGYSFEKVIHPSAIIMDDVIVGEGAQIMAGAIVQNGCIIGDNAIINTGAIIDHDCVIGKHTHVAPGVVLSGGVQIGDMVHIGTAATIIQGITIGDGAIIGAGAVVINEVRTKTKVVGVPARPIQRI